MSINKKEYRKHSDPELRMNRNNGLLHAEQIKYIVRTATQNIAGQRLLLLYIYSREQAAGGNFQPQWTMFQSKKDYITLARQKDGATKWHTSVFENLERDYHFEEKCAFYNPSDEQRVLRFCKTAESSGFCALSHLQYGIKVRQELFKRHAKQRKIIERMSVLKSLPRDLKGWVHREVLPAYLFYDYLKGKAPMKGYCTYCRHEVQVIDVKHNQKGICPRCKKEVHFKARGRRGYINDRATAQVLQKTGQNELVVRVFKIYCNYNNEDVPQLNIYEGTRIFVKRDGQKKFVTEPYHSSCSGRDLTPWKEGYYPVWYQYQENFYAEVCGHLYHRNLDKELTGTPWQYCQLKEYYQHDRVALKTVPYLQTYLEAPMLEYLVKFRLFWLATHIVYGSRGYYGQHEVLNLEGKTLKEVLGVEKTDISFLQQANIGIKELKLLQIMREKKMQPDTALFHWVNERKINATEDLTSPLSYVMPQKLMGYLDEQYEVLKDMKSRYGGQRYDDINSVLTEYKDYLKSCGELTYDLKDSFILFPRDLSKAHDQAINMMDLKKVAQYDEQIASIHEQLAKLYQYRENGLIVLPPKSAQEIVAEGQKLHHCVGSYIANVVEKRCAILFIRKEQQLEKPFFTVEVRGDEVIQARGEGNDGPPPEIKQFLERWTNKKALKMRTAA